MNHLQRIVWLYNARKFIFVGYIMFKFISLVVAVSTTLSVQAEKVQYTQGDASVASKVCVIAAEQGLSAARAAASQHGIHISRFSASVLCNGEDIRDVAKKVNNDTRSDAKKVALYAKTSTSATELCIKAAKNGLSSISKYGHKARSLRCNDVPVREFVRKFENTAI
ncbi:exonuclease III [Pseudoalteromonas sp. MMG012]|nr:exonuclease III [Pseudoalteromonas sp. MMG012]